ncbi:MAG: hypothetical protein JSV16_01715, partial [Candidatus Hydrogenedentota bacterium]
EPKVHDSEEWLGGVQEQCKDETRRIIGMLESLEIQWKNVRQQCDVAFGVLPLEDQVDQMDQELASFKEELKDIRQQYDGGDATALDRLREMELRVARSQERLEGIRERCEDTPGLILRGLELLGRQLMRVKQHCEGGDATALKHEFDELKTKIVLLEVLSRDIRQQHGLGLVPVSRNQLETAGRGIDLLDKQLGDIEQEHRWVDVLVLKNGSRIRCEIIGESVEKVRFRTPQGRAEVSRNEINFVAYSTDIQKGIAKILKAEVPQTRHRISKLEEKITAPEEEREPAAPEEPESPPEGEPEKGLPREGPPEEPPSVYRASIPIPLLEEKWRITNDCAEGAGVSFDDDTISIFTSHRIGRSACTTTISTTDPVQGDPHSIEMLAQVRRIKAPIDDRAIFSLVVTFSDGKSIEYSIFDSQADQNSAEVLRTADGLRIDRPELRILANKSWHVPVLPLSKDAAKIGGSKEITSIALVHRHEGPTACKFVLVCKAIIVNTM